MKKILLGFALAVASVSAFAQSWSLDKAHAKLGFEVTHLMVSSVEGSFKTFDVKVTSSKDEFADAVIELTADASSIYTDNDKRDEHLRSADFLDVAGHPLITFKSTRIQAGKGGALFVIGDLTIRGTTREVTLDVETPSPEVRDPWGNVKRGIAARARINRKDFGVSWNVALEAGGILVGDEISINLEIELLRKPATAA